MKRARQDQVVVGADLVQAALVEAPVVDQATRLVYYDESKDSPVFWRVCLVDAPE